jgi:cytochrome c oxidase subunit 2
MNWLPYSLPLADANKTFWFPEQASTFAAEVDSFFYFILWLSVFFFVLIVGGMAYFIWKYRERPGYRGNPEAEHNTPLEITWTVLPTFIVIYIFVRGAAGYLNMSRAPSETLDIQVQAQKWAWTFTYPNGAVSPELHLPIDQAAKMVMRSSDVIHSFFVPAFRAKSDVVPGRYNLMWFQPTKEGTYDLLCTEYCGDKHSEMLTKVTVHSKEGYEKWVADAAKPPEDPVEHGKWIYERYGCKSCHSLDGSKVVGPSFQGSWGVDVALAGGKGSQAFDENYVRESILDPQAKARSGYEAASAMPSYQGRLKEEQLAAVIEFLKSLKK